jgi:para-aminobenzoate synthetase component 1
MQPLIEEFHVSGGLDATARAISETEDFVVYLRGGLGDFPSRHSILAARPMLRLNGRGANCELRSEKGLVETGNPWHLTQRWIERFHIADESGLPLPMGGCLGYWGYHLKDLVEPTLRPAMRNDKERREPDCALGFFSSLVAHDHESGKTWIVSTGLDPSGERGEPRARAEAEWWKGVLSSLPCCAPPRDKHPGPSRARRLTPSMSREAFIERVLRAREYIRAGDIYQVNLSYQFQTEAVHGWRLFHALSQRSPAPFSAWMKAPGIEMASSSPEQFLRISDREIRTRPIKGTRPRSEDATRDTQLAYELQTSPKENAELVMITDLLRNDLGKVCEFGSVHVPEVARLEKYAQVQHLVSTVEGRLRGDVSHARALESCFPGGSITGAPKFRAMQIIDELETMPRGAYTGALGYVGFNMETQVSIVIRTSVNWNGSTLFNVGSGIVADSDPEAEHEETLVKARGFFSAIESLDTAPEATQ